MKEIKQCMVSPDDDLRAVLRIIDNSDMQIALVVDSSMHLLGTVTDGDIRRALLKGIDLDKLSKDVMNQYPLTATRKESKQHLLQKMRERDLHHIPILDEDGKLLELLFLEDLIYPQKKENPVILMVGGLGTRLRPLTNNCPKPLLKVGRKPILETILDNFIEAGFQHFYFAVNYKSQMIEEYFGDGSSFGIDIQYINEKKRMGTAGALYLLPERPTQDIIVMNGDLLTKVDFGALLDYHKEQKAIATMAVREYSYQVPYGVIDYDGARILAIKEKPAQSFFVNAGIYVLSPRAVAKVDKEEFLDMPELFNQIIVEGGKTIAFPIREYWLDIGKIDDFERAQHDYEDIF